MINELIEDKSYTHDKTHQLYNKINGYLVALNSHEVEIPEEVQQKINQELNRFTSFEGNEKKVRKELRYSFHRIKKWVVKDLKLVPIDHYKNLWMALGISLFGVPFGATWMSISGNAAYFAIGIPLGMVIGLSIGINLDKKAERNGLQLDFKEHEPNR